MYSKLSISEVIVLADKHGDKHLIDKLNNILSRSEDDYDRRAVVHTAITQTITYADNRPLFKELSKFCLDNFQSTHYDYAVEFSQRLNYSPSRLKEDDMTEFLISLYSCGVHIIRDHQHFFSDTYQTFLEL